MNKLYLYLLSVISQRYGILVHGVVLMSTHEHLVITDVQGELPRFLAELHRMVALCVKALRKWDGEVWDGGKTSVVELRTSQAIIEKLGYVAANPVAAGLVRRACEWPGIVTLPNDLGKSFRQVERPSYHLDPRNPEWPLAVTLELTLPPSIAWGISEIRRAFERELLRIENGVHQHADGPNGAVTKLMRLSPFARAKSPEPSRQLCPSFAVGRGQRDAFHAAVRVLREFRLAYRAALEAWRLGVRSVAFPRATWLMRTLHGAAVA